MTNNMQPSSSMQLWRVFLRTASIMTMIATMQQNIVPVLSQDVEANSRSSYLPPTSNHGRERRFCPPGEWYEKRGTTFTSEFRLYFCDNVGNIISPWHDIPLRAINDGSGNVSPTTPLFNFIVEIPRHAHAKMEINKFLPLNPIMQDKWKDGSPRFVGNLWPYQGYLWNYGALPQTFEDPKYECPRTAAVGDFDPVDVIEIGQRKWSPGSVIKVKVVGVLPLIDQGESDWKVIAIYYKDPLANKIHSLADIERLMPGFVNDTARWFTLYKVPTGKQRNVIAMSGFAEDVDLAYTIIDEVHLAWQHLHMHAHRCQREFSIYCNHTSPNKINRFFLSQSQAQQMIQGPEPTEHDAALPSNIDAWNFIDDYRWYSSASSSNSVVITAKKKKKADTTVQQQQPHFTFSEPIDSFTPSTCSSSNDKNMPCV